jgi:hypothetical protein
VQIRKTCLPVGKVCEQKNKNQSKPICINPLNPRAKNLSKNLTPALSKGEGDSKIEAKNSLNKSENLPISRQGLVKEKSLFRCNLCFVV